MRKIKLSMSSEQFKGCENCKKRSEGCHSGCEDYAKEVILGAIIASEEKKKRKERDDRYEVAEKRAVRIAKSSPEMAKQMRKNPYVRRRGGR